MWWSRPLSSSRLKITAVGALVMGVALLVSGLIRLL